MFLGVSVATCMAILQVGSGLQLRSASTGTKEEDYENDAATIVQKCVSNMRSVQCFLVPFYVSSGDIYFIHYFYFFPPDLQRSRVA